MASHAVSIVQRRQVKWMRPANEASERKVETMMITKEEILEALREGRVSCNLKGADSSFGPREAGKFLVKNLDRVFDPRYKVDLSFEKTYANMLSEN